MRLTRKLKDERGSVLVTSLLATTLMLAMGLALLAIVDTQALQSARERTQDRSFNLSESVLNSEAFVLGRNWPSAAPVGNPACSAAASGFGDTIGSSATPSTATARLRPNLNASYTDSAYSGATWQVNVCDDVSGSTVWSNSLLNNKNWDANGNQLVWVYAQSKVGGKNRTLAGLVNARQPSALNSKYGVVSGNLSEDLGPVTAAITNTQLVSALTNGLLTTNPPVLQDAAYPVPASGVTGLRCGLLNNLAQVKTCITGAIGALSQVPLINTLVTQGRYEQYPSTTSTSPNTIGQLRHQSKDGTGVYLAAAPGNSSAASAPSCGVTQTSVNGVVFIEQVGTGDQWCVLDVSTSRSFRALVVGSGRVIIRGNGMIDAYSATSPTNLFTGVVYALNLQTADKSVTSPQKEIVRVESGARVRGTIHADGKNAAVGLIAPDFNTDALINGLLCPGLLCSTVPPLLRVLGVSAIVDGLVNGICLVTLPILGCTVRLPALGLGPVVGNITAQLSTYGSAIHSDVAVIKALKVFGSSGVVPGTFRDLQPR